MNELLTEILAAREQRAAKQRQLLSHYQKPLLCFTMNIPGPKKYDRDVAIGFFVGKRLLAEAIPSKSILHFEENTDITGCEAFYVVDMPAQELKQLAVSIEDSHPAARLFDMDVLNPAGSKLERQALGLPRRTCLLCQQDAVICASSRAHSIEQLQERTGFLLYMLARQLFAEYIGVQAYMALQREVYTTPKPGLVDQENRGAHKDMDMRHFFASANALRPFFTKFAEHGYLTRDDTPEKAFAESRAIGIEAERAMLNATHGVNTHKGAIFSLGLLCVAAGRLSPADWSAQALLALCAQMTAGLVAKDFAGISEENAVTAGQKIYACYGISGVRGEAELGFPAVRDVGLPVLTRGLEQGSSFNDAMCATLLHLIAATDDTNLIHRSDRQTQLAVKAQVADILKDDPYPNQDILRQLDQAFIEKNLSPGGSADLLALTCLLYFLTQ